MNNSSKTSAPLIAWIDVETNGLDARENMLLEVACIIADFDFNIIHEAGYQSVIHYPTSYVEIIKEHTDPYVVDMHEKTGLWDRLKDGVDLELVDDQLLAYLSEHIPEKGTAVLGGNSITLDRNFLQANLPKSFAYIKYQSIDVTTIAILAKQWYNEEAYPKQYAHSALSDITESINELRYWRAKVFK
jgi:oligoribonuclease